MYTVVRSIIALITLPFCEYIAITVLYCIIIHYYGLIDDYAIRIMCIFYYIILLLYNITII